MLQDITGREINYQLITNYSQKLTAGKFLGFIERLRMFNVLIVAAKSFSVNLEKEAARQIYVDLAKRLSALFEITALFRAVMNRVKALLKND